MNTYTKQLNLFYIALAFLTRIPVPSDVDYSQDKLNQASRYFPLVGWLIGFVCAATFWGATSILASEVAILFSMLVGVFLTGCFHEDGLADTCDGFGGGWEKQQKLSIMKDSRLGTYGATGLWFILSIKFFLLFKLAEVSLLTALIAMIVAHPLSRAVSTSMIFVLPYVSDEETSKVKPLAESHNKLDLQISLSIGLFSLLLVAENALWIVIVLVIYMFLMRKLLLKQIQGFTGDTLGATQQVSEILIYTVLMVSSGMASGVTL
jgi:adenosylcobinamide-GDP ribazoletransferase